MVINRLGIKLGLGLGLGPLGWQTSRVIVCCLLAYVASALVLYQYGLDGCHETLHQPHRPQIYGRYPL